MVATFFTLEKGAIDGAERRQKNRVSMWAPSCSNGYLLKQEKSNEERNLLRLRAPLFELVAAQWRL